MKQAWMKTSLRGSALALLLFGCSAAELELGVEDLALGGGHDSSSSGSGQAPAPSDANIVTPPGNAALLPLAPDGTPVVCAAASRDESGVPANDDPPLPPPPPGPAAPDGSPTHLAPDGTVGGDPCHPAPTSEATRPADEAAGPAPVTH